MTTPNPAKLPPDQIVKELTKAARKVERLKLRIAARGRQIDALHAELRAAKVYLRAVATAASDSWPEPEPIDHEHAERAIDRVLEGD